MIKSFKKLPRHVQSAPFADSPMLSIEATDLELHKFVYDAYAQRVRMFLLSPQPQTTVRSNVDTFRRGTLTTSITDEVKAPDVSFLNKERTEDSFIALQSWEGYVKDVMGNEFIARLTDVKTHQDEDAIVPTKMVSHGDRPLLQVGAVFYWSIGYFRDWTDRVQINSELRFRRLKGPAESDFEFTEQEARKLSKSIGFTSDSIRHSGTIRS